jgi:hypothetical protein
MSSAYVLTVWQISHNTTKLESRLMLWPTVSRPVCLGLKNPSGDYDQICITATQLRVCWCEELSLTSGRVCRLQSLRALASSVILGPEFRGTRDHLLLSEIHDFSFVASYDSQKQKLTAGNQPARSHLASGPAGTHGHIFVQCQDLCFVLFFLLLILLNNKRGVGLLYNI